jgi:aspartyl-tRNA(Asn)/glutamyl-tRNA(Gln) amidotransferase subunit A
VGLKPTYGAVSRYGLIALASSLDQIGPMGHSVADVRAVYDAIKGHDAHDSTSLPDGFYAPHAKTPKVIGVPRSFLTSGVDPDVLACYEKTLKDLESQGYELRDIALPHAAYSLATYYVIQPAEASANLSRFDGIRYGLSVDSPTIQEVYEETRAQGFGPETRRRILTGTFVLSSGYFDAYYRRAQTVRDHIRADFASVFESVDAIATPTSPVPAFQIGEKSDPVAMYAADIFTVPVNLAGVPAISIPSGTVERDGTALPVGFQLIAPHGNETALFTIGEAVEASR